MKLIPFLRSKCEMRKTTTTTQRAFQDLLQFQSDSFKLLVASSFQSAVTVKQFSLYISLGGRFQKFKGSSQLASQLASCLPPPLPSFLSIQPWMMQQKKQLSLLEGKQTHLAPIYYQRICHNFNDYYLLYVGHTSYLLRTRYLSN